MQIQATPHSIKLITPFVISRGAQTYCNVVRVSIRYDQWQVQGECTPYARYGESVESVIEQIKHWSRDLETLNPFNAKQLLQSMPAGAARNAVDCALWQLIAQMEGSHFPAPYFDISPTIETAMTVSIGDVESMAKQARDYAEQGATLLKVKLDAEQVIEKVAAVRQAAPKCKIILDANEAWSELDLDELFTMLTQYDIAMIEQPLPSNNDARLADVTHPIPLCADESCHTAEHLSELIGRYEMINIKLDKTGGLTEALELESRARTLGFSVMVGCMLGSSLAMKAALPIATRAEIVDLDGPVLLGQDVANGLTYLNGTLRL
ncbi:N-acetyl-D-Glu racemase DgcA [Vibrio ouci]|uniref:Dipeptide epimerase n=1 Tax=Vibrio ouci TaxID=2499078 RepID=A0A4Y8WCC3_9VIBR|nr:N-acetyl-D-Glu racemase DgcA [Vibrio ouci]TFH90589.1 L-Ala-D/L-Glu epimerase [Vibrio ouci]